MIANVSAAGKKAPKRKRGQVDDEAAEEARGEVESIDEWHLDIADRDAVRDAGMPFGTGLPRADYVLKVSAPLSLDSARTRRQFSDSIKPYPASIARFMLQAGVGGGLDLDGVDGSSYMIPPVEAINIVNGQKLADRRPLLAGGGRQLGACVPGLHQAAGGRSAGRGADAIRAARVRPDGDEDERQQPVLLQQGRGVRQVHGRPGAVGARVRQGLFSQSPPLAHLMRFLCHTWDP